MAITITTASGSRTVDAFRVLRDESPRALRGERAKGTTRTIVYGDRGKRPSALEIEMDVQEATLGATAQRAANIISDCEAATGVTTPRGTRSVNGVLWAEQRGRGPAVIVTCAFAPTGGTYS